MKLTWFSAPKCMAMFALVAIAILAPSTLAYASDINVSAPGSGAVVSSPFLLQASSPTCKSQATASMAYSLDSGSDTVFKPATSISTNVSASQGTHTLRVKSWGSSGAYCEQDVAITVGTGPSVSSPVNGATVPSTFLLNASAPTCGGQTTSSMAYSFDSNTDNVINATSINQDVSASAGNHILRVKAWGNGGAFCETALNINVSSQSVTITSPANNSTVPMTFQLKAQAPTCNGKSTSSMAYNFSGHPDTTLPGAQSISASVTAPTTGVQQLNAKAWNGNGDLCETSISVDAENTASDITISQPTDPNVAMTFPLVASSTSCQGLTTNSMTYSFDNLTDAPAVSGQSLNTNATAPGTGSHTLRVKAWNTSGGVCVQEMALNVIDGGGSGLTPPSNAVAVTNYNGGPALEQDYTDPNTVPYSGCSTGSADPNPQPHQWQTQPDCKTGDQTQDDKTGSSSYPVSVSTANPSTGDTNTREFTMTFSDVGAGVRWWDPAKGDYPDNPTSADNTYTHFQYDVWIYIPSTTDIGNIENIEMDMNQVIYDPSSASLKDLYIMADQCATHDQKWEIGSWTKTNQSCTASQFQPGWHHVQIQVHRDSNANASSLIYYDKFAIDGNVQTIDCGTDHHVCTFAPHLNTTWRSGTLGPNFQLDGGGQGNNISSGSINVYVDRLMIYEW